MEFYPETGIHFMKNKSIKPFVILLIILIYSLNTRAQIFNFSGQLTGWLTTNPDRYFETLTGFRYIPSLSLDKTITEQLSLDVEISFNGYGSTLFRTLKDVDADSKIKPYRLWTRFSTNQLEIRLGLQKINFGSATMLRPLMWFDRIDPRDPLKITDGVYGLLGRYYFLNNANIWIWGLYGNEETKGWEFIPTESKTPEFGGRIQLPVPRGEVGISYHTRKIDPQKGLTELLPLVGYPPEMAPTISGLIDLSPVRETRWGFDGKWDIEIGFWLEGAILHQDIDLLPWKYRRLMNVGLDYTFALGNGLNLFYEHFWYQMATGTLKKEEEGFVFSALSLNYPLGLLDNLTGMVYFDWDNQEWYRFLSFQRTLDRWQFLVMLFWNPDEFQIFQNQSASNVFGGKGFQIMCVFNH